MRALLWSPAFCDGGNRKTILRMAQAFRFTVGHGRSPEEILAVRPSSNSNLVGPDGVPAVMG